MASTTNNPPLKKKRERKKREIKTVPESVISAKQTELGEQMMQSLESREAVFERDTQYPIDTLADYFANIQLTAIAEQNIEDNEDSLEQLKTALPTEKEFYELVNLHLLDLLQQDDIMTLDAICNELVTNLRAGNDSVSVIKLNPPYNLLVDLAEISTGRGERIRTSDLRVPNAAR